MALIKGGDETPYRRAISRLESWCGGHHLELNASKTVEMIVDFRLNPAPLLPVTLGGTPITIVESTRFLGTIISRDLKWELNINALIKKAQMRMYFLWQLWKFRLSRAMMVKFYTAIIESILTLSITIWFPAATVKDKARVERVIRSAERVTGSALPSLKSLYEVRAAQGRQGETSK